MKVWPTGPTGPFLLFLFPLMLCGRLLRLVGRTWLLPLLPTCPRRSTRAASLTSGSILTSRICCLLNFARNGAKWILSIPNFHPGNLCPKQFLWEPETLRCGVTAEVFDAKAKTITKLKCSCSKPIGKNARPNSRIWR